MAAVRSCFFSPSPAFSAAASSSARPLRSSPAILPVGRREQQRFPSLKMRPSKEAAAPRPRRLFAARAQSRDAPPQREPSDHFAEEMEKISEHYVDIISIDHGSLYVEATAMSAQVCLSANQALAMASDIVDSAGLNLGAPNEISTETIHRTVRVYANVFFDAAKDSHRRTVNRKTVISFLRALTGLAAVSHILLEGALEALSHTLPSASLPEYALNADVKDMYPEFKQQMSELELKIQGASDMKTCKLAVPTILQGMEAAGSFVKLMVARRQRALEKARSKSAV